MPARLHPSPRIWGGAVLLIVLALVRFVPQHQRAAGGGEAPLSSSYVFVGPLPEEDPGCTTIVDTLRRNDSIYLSLRKHQVSERQIALLDQAVGKLFDSRTASRPLDAYTLTLDSSGVIQRFEYIPHRNPERPVRIERQNGILVGRRPTLPLTTRLEVLQTRIEDNLSRAIRAAGESDALTDILADEIFGAVIDFRREPRRGDRIGLVFEKQYKGGDFVRYGRILLARYDGRIASCTAVYFEDGQGRGGYYDAEGRSLERMFLLYALPYRGITSHFNPRRFHPVLKRRMPHLGTDYAASMGTRVWATARGKVVYAGWKGSLGKAVIVEHPNGYLTKYGHLSRILVKKGQRVRQKQIVGRVGATGRVTGPHLHYEILKDGRHLNPETVNRGTRGRPLGKEHLQAFHARRDSLLSLLDAARRGPAVASAAQEDGRKTE